MTEHHARSIVMVRHGQTAYNAAHRMQGQTDIALNDVGRWQAARTAHALRAEYVDPFPERRQLVVASNLSRAFSTAQAFASPLGLEVYPDERVRERNFGEWEGITPEQVQERWPEDYRLWMLSAGGELKHGAESKVAVGRRGLQALEDWIAKADEQTDLFIFSHGSWIAQTIQALMGLTQVHEENASLGSVRNAHWAHFVPRFVAEEGIRWALLDYNRGPVIARVVDWNNPGNEMLRQ
nr:histidine phosphatase family protein [Bombiscardovia apis]